MSAFGINSVSPANDGQLAQLVRNIAVMSTELSRLTSEANLANRCPVGTPEQRQEMLRVLQPYFDDNKSIDLKNTYCTIPGSIVQLETAPGKVAYDKPHSIPHTYRDAVAKQLQVWMDEGMIEPASTFTAWNLPLLPVEKRDSNGECPLKKIRLMMDVRQLNSILIGNDTYQLPSITEAYQRLSTATIISSIDVSSCFSSFLIDPVYRHKLAFIEPFTNQQYVFRKACFGIHFMPSVITRQLTCLFRDLPYAFSCVGKIYCATNNSFEDHTQKLAEIIRRLTSVNIQINLDKIVLAQYSVHVLGWSIVRGHFAPDPRKVANTHTWPIPCTGKGMERMLSYFNHFLPATSVNSAFAKTLHKLCGYKSLDCVWNNAHLHAWKHLKYALASDQALSPPDDNYRFHVATNASQYGIGGVIYYIKNNAVHYLAMASRKLTGSERNCSTAKYRELLAIVFIFTRYHTWLYGRRFTLHTDHPALVDLHTLNYPEQIILRWYDIIFAYDYDIVHLPGNKNSILNVLGRLFDKYEKECRPTALSKVHRGEVVKHRYTERRYKDKVALGNFEYSSFPTAPKQVENNDTASYPSSAQLEVNKQHYPCLKPSHFCNNQLCKDFMDYNRIIKDMCPINTKVMIVNTYRTPEGNSNWFGPFLIKGYTRDSTYLLTDLTGEAIARDVSAEEMCLLVPTEKHFPKDSYPWQTAAVFNSLDSKTAHNRRKIHIQNPSNQDTALPTTINTRKMSVRTRYRRTRAYPSYIKHTARRTNINKI